MSTKYVVAAAAAAAVAVEAARPLQAIQREVLINRPAYHTVLDEQQKANWNANANIQGGAGGRPTWSVGVGATWDEEQQVRPTFPIRTTGPFNPTPPFSPFDEEQRVSGEFNAGISGGAGGRPQYNAGVTLRWDEEEEQKLRLKKVLKTAVRGVQTYQKGQELGVWDEEQAYTTGAVNKDDFNINLTHKSGDKGDWRSALGKAYDLAKEAQKNGFFDEEQKANWNANANIQGGAGGRPTWSVGVGATWDEEQRVNAIPMIPRGAMPFDEQQADWAFNAGIQGGAGGRPQWNAGISAKWDEQQDIPIEWRRPMMGARVYDEEQATGEFNAGISGGAGGRPTYNAGVTIRWEEEEEQRNLLKKINNALGKVDNVVSTVNHVAATSQSVGALFDEEEQKIQLEKAFIALEKIQQISEKVEQLQLFDEDVQQTIGEKIDITLDRVNRALDLIERIKETKKRW